MFAVEAVKLVSLLSGFCAGSGKATTSLLLVGLVEPSSGGTWRPARGRVWLLPWASGHASFWSEVGKDFSPKTCFFSFSV